MVERPERRIATGFDELDQLTGGLRPGQLWVITGRSGSGKSVLALDLGRRAAIGQSVVTALVQARDPASEIAIRLMSAEARVPLHHLRFQGLAAEAWVRLSSRLPDLAAAPLSVTIVATSDNALPTADALLQAAAAVLVDVKPRLLVVDDLPSDTTPDQLGRLKRLGQDGGACVVAVVSRGSRRLKRIERDAGVVADLVLRINRDHDLDPEVLDPRIGEADFVIQRHRQGPIGVITVAFQGHYSRLVNMSSP